MKILAACEFSGRVRDAFAARGHEAWSCDLKPSVGDPEGLHYQGNLISFLPRHEWDLIIGFPPCTHLAVSGARHWEKKRKLGLQQKAVRFFMAIAECGAPRICIENPVGFMSTEWRKPDQIIHPWQFGHPEQKSTCLWLKGLPELEPTNIVEPTSQRIAMMPDSKKRRTLRSVTFRGIATAMSEQWG